MSIWVNHALNIYVSFLIYLFIFPSFFPYLNDRFLFSFFFSMRLLFLFLFLSLSATSLSLVFSSILFSVKSINKDSCSLLFLLLSSSVNPEIRSENQKRKQICSGSELHVMMKKVTKTEKRRWRTYLRCIV